MYAFYKTLANENARRYLISYPPQNLLHVQCLILLHTQAQNPCIPWLYPTERCPKRFFAFRLIKDGLCDRNTAPSVSAISRLLRGKEDDDEAKRGKERESQYKKGNKISLFRLFEGFRN